MSTQEKEMEKTVRLHRELKSAMGPDVDLPQELFRDALDTAELYGQQSHVFAAGVSWCYWKLNQPTKPRFPSAPIDCGDE